MTLSAKRTPAQTISLVAAALLGLAPLAFGLLRASQTYDRQMLWMALVVTIFAAGVLASRIGRRRSKHAAVVQSIVILIVGTISAGITAYLLGATASPGIWAVSFVLSLCLAASSMLLSFARQDPETH